MKANQELRDAAKKAGVKQWEIAMHIGISEPTLVRWMRMPMPSDHRKTILTAIAELSKDNRKEG